MENTGKYRILFAEDEPDLRDIMKEALEMEGYHCDVAGDGALARERLSREQYDLLITDFNMPGLNGAELLFWCREEGLHFPVIFVTATKERLPMEEVAMSDCCASLLTKPVAINDILAAIEEAKKRRHDFDCNGEVLRVQAGDSHHFPGQHIQC